MRDDWKCLATVTAAGIAQNISRIVLRSKFSCLARDIDGIGQSEASSRFHKGALLTFVVRTKTRLPSSMLLAAVLFMDLGLACGDYQK